MEKAMMRWRVSRRLKKKTARGKKKSIPNSLVSCWLLNLCRPFLHNVQAPFLFRKTISWPVCLFSPSLPCGPSISFTFFRLTRGEGEGGGVICIALSML